MEHKGFFRPRRRDDGAWMLSDIYAASFMHAHGHRILDVIHSGQDNRMVFVFTPSDFFLRDYRQFEDDAPITIHRFLNSLRTLKATLRDAVGDVYLKR